MAKGFYVLSRFSGYNTTMVRPENCVELAGRNPVTVSAGAPCSRPRAARETEPSERGVESPQLAVRLVGGEQVGRPSIKRTLQPRDIRIRKDGWPSRSFRGEGNSKQDPTNNLARFRSEKG